MRFAGSRREAARPAPERAPADAPTRSRRRQPVARLVAVLAVLGLVGAVDSPAQAADARASRVRPAAAARTVNGVTLVNDVTRRPVAGVSPITEGAVIDLTRLANRRLSLRATLMDGVRAGSVSFTLTGAKRSRYARTDNAAPYFLGGDYVDCRQLATPDRYTLVVQPYLKPGAAGGVLGPAFTVHFTVSATPVAAAPVDVLLVGNSLTGNSTGATHEDTPAVVQHLASMTGRTIRMTKVIRFGSTLQQTWDAGEVSGALDGSTRYDFVVLQEYSTVTATDLEAASSALTGTYAPAISRVLKPGGKVVLFKNWALTSPAPFADRAENVAAIDAHYATLAARLTIPTVLAPISDEFETVIRARGTSFLIVPDGKHPTDAAIYLDAVTLYGIIFGRSPRALADLYLPSADASYLRAVAATAIGY